MTVPQLNRTIESMAGQLAGADRPVRALQIGEGNFIRAFVDWMLHRCNEQNVWNGGVVVTQPREQGAPKLQKLKDQDGLFTVLLRGLEQGEKVDRSEVVSSITEMLDPYTQWDTFLELAARPELEFVFSNTTEAGIVYVQEERDFSQPIHSFPGKLTAFLYERFQKLGSGHGLTMLPCELLERAGDTLREIVLQHAAAWQLGEAFERWVQEENLFINSLVDRIVTGYPDQEAHELQQKFGYQDKLVTVAEPYHQWVIEADDALAQRLPLHQAGLNVLWVSDLTPYVQRKVRVLNGAHTFMLPIAFLRGYDIVRDAVNDSYIAEKVHTFLKEVVTPVLPFTAAEIEPFIQATLERFANPYIDHRLLDIALNTTSKFGTRLLPTLQDYVRMKEEIPALFIDSIAALIRFYRCRQEGDVYKGWRLKDGEKEEYVLQDAPEALAAFARLWSTYEQTADVEALVWDVLSSEAIWETPLNTDNLRDYYDSLCIQTSAALQEMIEQ